MSSLVGWVYLTGETSGQRNKFPPSLVLFAPERESAGAFESVPYQVAMFPKNL